MSPGHSGLSVELDSLLGGSHIPAGAPPAVRSPHHPSPSGLLTMASHSLSSRPDEGNIPVYAFGALIAGIARVEKQLDSLHSAIEGMNAKGAELESAQNELKRIVTDNIDLLHLAVAKNQKDIESLQDSPPQAQRSRFPDVASVSMGEGQLQAPTAQVKSYDTSKTAISPLDHLVASLPVFNERLDTYNDRIEHLNGQLSDALGWMETLFQARDASSPDDGDCDSMAVNLDLQDRDEDVPVPSRKFGP
ncbi:hypothetical protein N7492_009985 [Penicillium capsulatum]|uniref:Uncharacterized protein n=1 Tax=Penicillium capsulatum TaxID=69766 RepID=A0A9W9HN58_9EURO|nr:hypothetical protein N7492_009985 [Penicillium capsulatum]KAJ6112494.1 hypothetical protein N7512_007818 [Penicillium capsulatum]